MVLVTAQPGRAAELRSGDPDQSSTLSLSEDAVVVAALFDETLEDLALPSGSLEAVSVTAPARFLPPYVDAVTLVAQQNWAPVEPGTDADTLRRTLVDCRLALPEPVHSPSPGPARTLCVGPIERNRTPNRLRADLNEGTETDSNLIDRDPTMYQEGDTTWLYFVSSRNNNSNGTYPYRVPINARGEAVATPERLSTASLGIGISLSDRDPFVRPDGLEMFFSSSRGSDWALHTFYRKTIREAWSVDNLTTMPLCLESCGPMRSPVLLPDFRTLLFISENRPGLTVARRASPEPGNAGFEVLDGSIETTPGARVASIQLAKDGWHLVIAEVVEGRHSHGIVQILGLNPTIQLGPVSPLGVQGDTPVSIESLSHIAEAPGGQFVFFSDEEDLYSSAVVSCP